MVEVYLTYHYTTLLNTKYKVREVFLTAMKGGLKAGMIDLAKQRGVLHRNNTRPPRPAQASPRLRWNSRG